MSASTAAVFSPTPERPRHSSGPKKVHPPHGLDHQVTVASRSSLTLSDSSRSSPRSRSSGEAVRTPATSSSSRISVSPTKSKLPSDGSSSFPHPAAPSRSDGKGKSASSTVHALTSVKPPPSDRATGKMHDGDFASALDAVNAGLGGGSKADRILGPDGRLYTQGEAARLGLIIRTACEACRNRKLKCSGVLPEDGGCGRCNSDNVECVYSARAPIGRPKKRKAEEGRDASNGSASPSRSAASTQDAGPSTQKAKLKGKSRDLSGDAAVRMAKIKSEDSTSSVGYPFGSSRASSFPENLFLAATPESSAAPHDSHSSTMSAANMFGIGPSPLSTPGMLAPNIVDARLPSTPSVWSQHQLAYAVTPSDVLTPASGISLSDTSHARSAGTQSNLSSKMPSLDDLSVAAFLQSLDMLEISSEELLHQQQQQQRSFSEAGPSSAGSANATFVPNTLPEGGEAQGVPTSSVEAWAMSSAVLQPGLSFAVPADFSWWDLGLNGADFSSAGPSLSGTPSTEPSAFPSGLGQITQTSATPAATDAIAGGASASPSGKMHTTSTTRKRRPTIGSDRAWPRGALAGMGQGQIQQAVAATESGLGWSTLPAIEPGRTPPSPSGHGSDVSDTKSCCSSKTKDSKDNLRSGDPKRHIEQVAESVSKSPCCTSEQNRQTSSPEQPAKGTPSCCAGKTALRGADDTAAQRVQVAETKSCCSGHGASAPSTIGAEGEIEMGPLSTSAAVTGKGKEALDGERRRHAETHVHHPGKVHCVPNPNGKGCTCLCDMSVALLSVKQVLRETDPQKRSDASRGATADGRGRASFATDTIQLTLTASQAITAQCACSADCPTCQSDPSTEISASLLVSTALQIYARAVRILREGFAASSTTKSDPSSEAATTAAGGFFGGLDVTIGTYKPSAANAKKIALYAIKLELKDLRRALGKISRMAQNWGSTDPARSLNGASQNQASLDQKSLAMNPIDQLVILKLYRQLTELLKTVEGLEDAA